MFVLFGFKTSSRTLGLARAACPHCGHSAAQRIDRNRRAFSLFFIPVVPLGSSYSATCTACARTTRIDRRQADRILAGGS